MASDAGPAASRPRDVSSARAVHARIIVAGTFDVLHDGHFALLHTAFGRGRHVEIWVTDDALGAAKAAKTGQHIQPYTVRAAHLAAWCDEQTPTSIAHFVDIACPPIRDVLPSGLPDAGAVLGRAEADTAVAEQHAEGSRGGHAGHEPGSGTTGAEPAVARPYRGRYSLHELHDPYGASVHDGSYTAIVCSEETLPGCEAINARRAEAGLPQLEIVLAPLVWDNHRNKKLSSTDLRAARGAGTAAQQAPAQP
jgi:phosphopantetheine adenylyltransferase